MVIRASSCPQCRGDLWLDQDEYGWYEQCLLCGYLCSLEGLRYVCGAETVAVTRQKNPRLYPFQSVIETLKRAMQQKMEEARGFIISELARGALESRQLRSRLTDRGIIQRTFETALQELRDAGLVTAIAVAGKNHRKKFALVKTDNAYGCGALSP